MLSNKAQCDRSYHHERESNNRNGHRGKVFVVYHTNIILVTEPSSVNCSLDDGVVVWVTASPRFLMVRLSHRRLTTRMTQANRVNKIHLPQQALSASGVIAYASVGLARLEAIHIFHESRNLGFHFSA